MRRITWSTLNEKDVYEHHYLLGTIASTDKAARVICEHTNVPVLLSVNETGVVIGKYVVKGVEVVLLTGDAARRQS